MSPLNLNFTALGCGEEHCFWCFRHLMPRDLILSVMGKNESVLPRGEAGSAFAKSVETEFLEKFIPTTLKDFVCPTTVYFNLRVLTVQPFSVVGSANQDDGVQVFKIYEGALFRESLME